MEGEVQSWGQNQNGQLGLGTTQDTLVPQKIEAFQGVKVKIFAAGAEHIAAITEDGEPYVWGWSQYGNLGLGDRKDRNIPEKTSIISGVACGWRHTICVSSCGDIYTYDLRWLEALYGVNCRGKAFGQIGVGDNQDHCSPMDVKLPDEQKVVQISCGWRHTLAVREGNNVFSWGRGTNGQLGYKQAVDRNISRIIEALSVDGYAVVPDETVQARTNGNDASVPENDVKRIRLCIL